MPQPDNCDLAKKVEAGPIHDAGKLMPDEHDDSPQVQKLRASLKPSGQARSTVKPIRGGK